MLNIRLIECFECHNQYDDTNDACTHCGTNRNSPTTRQKGVSKQSSRKVVCDDYAFDSRLEFNRYGNLKLRAIIGIISDLRVHPKFILMPKIKGVVSAITYEADFSYIYEGKLRIEDVKAVYGNTKKNIAKGIAGKAIIKADARLRHKMLISKLWHEYGNGAEFRIVTDIGE